MFMVVGCLVAQTFTNDERGYMYPAYLETQLAKSDLYVDCRAYGTNNRTFEMLHIYFNYATRAQIYENFKAQFTELRKIGYTKLVTRGTNGASHSFQL